MISELFISLLFITIITIYLFYKKYITLSSKKKISGQIGIKRFNQIFTLDSSLNEDINNYKNKPTMIHIDFISILNNSNVYEKIKFLSANKEFSIVAGKSIDFEYKNDKYLYKSEITEKISLIRKGKEEYFLINIKRHHDNYYNLFIDVVKDITYSIEIVFYSKDSLQNYKYLDIENIRIEGKEFFTKTARYNIINMNFDNSVKIFNIYSEITLNENPKESNEAFKQKNLFYNFICSKNKKLGKIYPIEEEKEIDNFNKNELKILEKINELVTERINIPTFNDDFEDLKKEYNYDVKSHNNEKKTPNILIDLNEKFKRIPFFLKYYDKQPSQIDLNYIKSLCFLNIFIEKDMDEWRPIIIYLQNETDIIFQNNKFLSIKDKIMILLNFLIAIKNKKDLAQDYKFISFYQLNEESTYIKSEQFYRDIISQLNEESSLFFLYLQLNSGSFLDFISGNHFYKIRHISLIELKTHLLMDYFYPYFFVFFSGKEIMAWNGKTTQVKNYNEKIFNKYGLLEKEFYINETVKLTLLKMHEYAHTKFKGNYSLQISPRYLINNDLDYIDNRKESKEIIKVGEIIINDYLGESGEALEIYIFGDKKIVNNILNSKNTDLTELYNPTLFIEKDFKKLNAIINKLKIKNVEDKNNTDLFNTKLRKRIVTTIPKIKIEKAKFSLNCNDLGIEPIDY